MIRVEHRIPPQSTHCEANYSMPKLQKRNIQKVGKLPAIMPPTPKKKKKIKQKNT
jgi:hypothetical protein